MTAVLKIASVSLVCVCLSACGFTPMYAQPEASQLLFNDLKVVDGASGVSDSQRTSYDLSIALQERLTASNAPNRSATITVWLSEERVNLGVQSTDASTRKDLYLTVRYEFVRSEINGTSPPPIKGTMTSVVTYNVSASPYAEVAALQDARRRAADDAADRIANSIALKIKK